MLCTAYQKSKNPSPDDEVWRLIGIAKNGKICQRLEQNEIFKVKDLITYQNNEIELSKVSPFCIFLVNNFPRLKEYE